MKAALFEHLTLDCKTQQIFAYFQPDIAEALQWGEDMNGSDVAVTFFVDGPRTSLVVGDRAEMSASLRADWPTAAEALSKPLTDSRFWVVGIINGVATAVRIRRLLMSKGGAA